MLGGSIYPEIVQRFVVAPNEIDKERPYIANAIEFTRKAYALDRFEEREFSAVEDLSLNDIRQNEATFRNVRLWDHKPLLTTFAQLQEIRTYYDFRILTTTATGSTGLTARSRFRRASSSGPACRAGIGSTST